MDSEIDLSLVSQVNDDYTPIIISHIIICDCQFVLGLLLHLVGKLPGCGVAAVYA